jgi:CTP synthase
MRLGAQPTCLETGSIVADCYGITDIHERHRHRYEFNNVYRQQFARHGMRFSGTSPDGFLVEVVELLDQPWFVAVQYHPEFKSKPISPHPLFTGFVGAAVAHHAGRLRPAHPQEPTDEGVLVSKPAKTPSTNPTK